MMLLPVSSDIKMMQHDQMSFLSPSYSEPLYNSGDI